MTSSGGQPVVRFATAIVVLAIVAWATVGAGFASGQSTESYAVRQGDQCVPITPLSGDEPVLEFYGYQSTFEDNPYTTTIGPGFSSQGTLDLQVPETSLLFLYHDPEGNLSLVMVHGSREGGVDGGSASFDVSGLPADGWWVVKDDDYDSPANEDAWTHGETTAEIDWTWGRSATDGGAFEGLGDEFDVTIDPAFNGEAELFGEANSGAVDNWTALSGDRERPNRTSLDLEENVTISTVPCEEVVATPEDESTGTTTASASDGGDGDDDGAEADDGRNDDDGGDRSRDEDRDRDRDDDADDGDRFGDGDRDRDRDDEGRGNGFGFGDGDDRFGEDGDRDRDRDDDDRGDGFPFGGDDDSDDADDQRDDDDDEKDEDDDDESDDDEEDEDDDDENDDDEEDEDDDDENDDDEEDEDDEADDDDENDDDDEEGEDD